MARQIESDLYKKLVESEFVFVPKGETTILDIYKHVKKKFNKLCDDTYLCKDNCKNGNNRPEWQHIVRSAIHRLQNVTDVIEHSKVRGTWIFNPEKFSKENKDKKKKVQQLAKETKPKVTNPKVKTVEDTKIRNVPKGKKVETSKVETTSTKSEKDKTKTPKVKEVKTTGPLSTKTNVTYKPQTNPKKKKQLT